MKKKKIWRIVSIKVKVMTLCELNQREGKEKKSRGQEKYLGNLSYGFYSWHNLKANHY